MHKFGYLCREKQVNMKIRAFITMAMAGGLLSATAANLPDNTGMELDAQTWCRNVSAGWNLGNSLESAGANWDNTSWTWTNAWQNDRNQWETAWNNPVTTEAMIRSVREAGFDAIRIPVRWEGHITDYDKMTIDPIWMARVKEVVDYAIAQDMQVILNTHHELWLEYNPLYRFQTRINDRLTKIWTQIAETFAQYDGRLAFAGTNEVQINWAQPTAENLAVQNSYNQTFVNAVRATGGKNHYRNLIIQTYSCNPRYGISGLVVPDDVVEGRLSVEFHYYDPYEYCGSGKYYYWGEQYRQYGETPTSDEEAMKNLLIQAQNAWWQKGLGVIVGEYGVTNHYNASASEAVRKRQLENQQYWYSTFVGAARECGFAAFAWDNNVFGNGEEKFGIFNRNSAMRVDNSYALAGILEGAKREYVEPNYSGETPVNDWYSQVGRTLWSGQGKLAWGDGFQLSLPASTFSTTQAGALFVIYYEIDATADYSMVQFYDGSWTSNPKFQYKGNTSHEFNLRDLTGQISGSHITPLVIPAAALSILRSKGMKLQGYGATLTQVVLVEANLAGIETIEAERAANGNADQHIIYNMQGQRVSLPSRSEEIGRNGDLKPGSLYIVDGKKILVR